MTKQETISNTTTATYNVNLKEEHKKRYFFIFIDGTWNEERSNEKFFGYKSNVRKMYDFLAEDSDTQISRYFRGVGNAQDNNTFMRKINGFTGGDENQIRKSAYATINKEYRSGDIIIIIGFSRGAACARLLAFDLCTKGLRESITITSQKFTNRLTKQVESKITDYKQSGKNIDVNVRFLGCWDTVGAFVIPVRFIKFQWLDKVIRRTIKLLRGEYSVTTFTNLEIHKKILHAIHCVSIDETRNAFLPTLMEPREGVEEVWFPGVHADVGGGYHRDGISRVTLEFMIKRLDDNLHKANLPKVEWIQKNLKPYINVAQPKYCIHYHGAGFMKSIRKIRIVGANKNLKPKIHTSVSTLWQSGQVFSCNEKENQHWQINYQPFNISELNDENDISTSTSKNWPFIWIET